MNIEDVLNSIQAELPKEPYSTDFLDHLNLAFDDYYKLIGSLVPSNPIELNLKANLNSIKHIGSNVLLVLTRYFDGHPQSAYSCLKNIFRRSPIKIDPLFSKKIDKTYLSHLYRGRTIEDGGYTPKEMFHRPFEARGQVASFRYSIHGFPSLYLGSSSYVIWKEFGMPDMNRLTFSRFEANSDDIRVLDFGITPRLILDSGLINDGKYPGATYYDIIYTYLVYWPLVCACAIQVKNRNDVFKPEYIVPQLVLQYVRESSIDGVRYFSMHFGKENHDLSLGSNWVFPPKQSQPSGHCPILKSMFKVSYPLDWKFSINVNLPSQYNKVLNKPIHLPNGKTLYYHDSKFAELDARLSMYDVWNIQ